MNIVDTSILLWLNNLAVSNHALSSAFVILAKYAPFVFALLFAVFFLVKSSDTPRMRKTILLSILFGVAAVFINYLIAMFVYRPRPFTVLPSDQLQLLIPHAADTSFPSDHGVFSAVFAVGMLRAPGKLVKWIFIVTALLVGVSRIVVGVHWPSDILGSFILGGLESQIFFFLSKPLMPMVNWVIRVFESGVACTYNSK